MEANIKQNTLRKNSYNNFSFWENKILNDEDLWEGYFENKEITKTSKIIYTGIFDLDKDILQCGWAAYPDDNSLLGFLQFIFLPTAFFSWFDRKSDNFYIPVADFETLASETLKSNNSDIDLDFVNSMQESHNLISNLWNYSDDSISSELKSFCDKFNATWNNDPKQKLFIKIFDNPCDIFEFVRECIIRDSKDLIEEDISMTLDSLRFACENAIEEPLLNKRFIDILNTNEPILF